MEDVGVGNGGHQEMHKDLLPPLVASFGECVVRVVLISRIDSTHMLGVTFNRDRLLKIGLTSALLRYGRCRMDIRQQANWTLVEPTDSQHLVASKKQR